MSQWSCIYNFKHGLFVTTNTHSHTHKTNSLKNLNITNQQQNSKICPKYQQKAQQLIASVIQNEITGNTLEKPHEICVAPGNSICLNSGNLLRWSRALLTLGATLLRHTWFLNISLIMETGSFQEPNRPEVLGINPCPPKTLIQDY